MSCKDRKNAQKKTTGHRGREFPKGTAIPSPFRLHIVHALLIPILLILAGCGPTRCLNVAAFGNLGPQVNSPYDDYAPALQDSATLVFTSDRIEPGEGGLQQFYQNIRPTRLFFTMRLDEDWDDAQIYQMLFDKEGRGTEAGTISFAPPGAAFNTMAYVGVCPRGDSAGGCDLFAIVQRQQWLMVNLGSDINSAGWDGQPFVSRDGTRLYFASDRPGGFGGSDIWYSERLSTGAWGTPHNAGTAVNTPDDELSPFLDDATGRLYFASATSGAGLDLYVLDRGSSARRRLPPPYNSEDDDFTPFLLNGYLYLASNRGGGCGGYDLYGFALNNE